MQAAIFTNFYSCFIMSWCIKSPVSLAAAAPLILEDTLCDRTVQLNLQAAPYALASRCFLPSLAFIMLCSYNFCILNTTAKAACFFLPHSLRHKNTFFFHGFLANVYDTFLIFRPIIAIFLITGNTLRLIFR